MYVSNTKMMSKEKLIHCKNNNLTVKQSAEYCGVTTRTISHWKKIYNISWRVSKSRIYTLNEKYFDKIDTEEKAYILGFISADGCLTNKGLNITINKKDIQTLNKIKSAINSNADLKYLSNNRISLSLYSTKLINSLHKLGLTPNKTFTLTIPKINNDLLNHYLRGYFDGDGYMGRQCKLASASKSFTEELLAIIYTQFPNLKIWVKLYNNTYTLSFGKKDRDFVNWLYKNASIYMERKYIKYLEHFSTGNG